MMSSTTDSQLKSIWSAIFSRKGMASSSTKLWDDWDEEKRRRLLDKVSQSELPVILSFAETEKPVLLTTQRLIVGAQSVVVKDMMDIKPVDFSNKEKSKLNELDIVMNGGGNFRVSIDAGSAYFGFWSVLLHITRSNGAKSKTS